APRGDRVPLGDRRRSATASDLPTSREIEERRGAPSVGGPFRGPPLNCSDELAHEGDGLVGVGTGLYDERVASAGEVGALDLPAGLPIRAHEGFGDGGRHVVVEFGLSDPRRG